MIIIFIFGSKIIHMNGDNIRVLMESKIQNITIHFI